MSAEQMWIAGEWCDAEDGATADIINPATGEVMASTPKATIADVNRCVEASRTALNDASWKAMDPAQRGRILNKMAQATYANAKSLAVIESNNNGKTFREALSEIRYGAWTLEYFAGLSDKIEGTTIPGPWQPIELHLAPTAWRDRSHRAVELPASTRPAIHRTCSRLWMHRDCKASVMDTALAHRLGQRPWKKQMWACHPACSR
jgi:hypothetical protein